jgi:hypothetical protein
MSKSLIVVCIYRHLRPTLLLIVVGYTVKFGQEEHRFFKQGRVFAMLWTETAGETHRRRARTGTENSMMTTQRYSNDTISQGRFGQDVYSQIRRFVIVRVNRRQHFVLAW